MTRQEEKAWDAGAYQRHQLINSLWPIHIFWESQRTTNARTPQEPAFLLALDAVDAPSFGRLFGQQVMSLKASPFRQLRLRWWCCCAHDCAHNGRRRILEWFSDSKKDELSHYYAVYGVFNAQKNSIYSLLRSYLKIDLHEEWYGMVW